jgi:D-xylose transport system substrate-binding protein
MTVYKPVTPQATDAAKAALALANGQKPKSTSTEGGVPATILTPIAVIQSNVKDTVVKDGLYTIAQICSGSVASACASAGLK